MSTPPLEHSSERAVLDLLQAKFGGQPQLDDSLTRLELDSLGMAELSLEFEKAFAIRIDERILDARTVRELVAYVDRRRAGQAAPGADVPHQRARQ